MSATNVLGGLSSRNFRIPRAGISATNLVPFKNHAKTATTGTTELFGHNLESGSNISLNNLLMGNATSKNMRDRSGGLQKYAY